ncbi:enoyl-CoA hydratase/isomerase family protein [Oceanibacterium hippocampi]|uniref:Carnitinyl-CoA dehydratase n=1 Tax=Oceanibacterium hippocampi TaxID=745714 RepID=A0A1Y5RN00_9PROT|nr:enoyl-CoA hydratase-related protein [Oceanibacterium hippocampi]SLN20164.1 Carnitinyl-CoA dehydratase [Oceanibacterium hippocampi]
MTASHLLNHTGNRVTLTLNRPERHNLLQLADLTALTATFDDLAARDDVRVLVLTGAGDRSFCAGVDLDGLGDYDFDDNPLEKLTDRLESLPFPTICALNGGVYGGGSDLALACDFRVGVDSMRCFVPPARFGIHYHPAGLQRMVTRLGLGPAKRLLLAAETMEADELLRIGFVDQLVPATDLELRVDTMANEIAGLAPLAVSGMKAALNEIARGTLDRAAALERLRACMQSADFAEGRQARAEKRKPVFRGR